MRILLDESLPRQRAKERSGHHVTTVARQGGAGPANGVLLRRAVADTFDVLVTGDRSIQYRWNTSSFAKWAASTRIEPTAPSTPCRLRAWMRHLRHPHYVGLLTAAARHGTRTPRRPTSRSPGPRQAQSALSRAQSNCSSALSARDGGSAASIDTTTMSVIVAVPATRANGRYAGPPRRPSWPAAHPRGSNQVLIS